MISNQMRGRYFILRSRKVCCTVACKTAEASSASSSEAWGALGELCVGADRTHRRLAQQHAALSGLDDLEARVVYQLEVGVCRQELHGLHALALLAVGHTAVDFDDGAPDPAAVERLAL